MAVPAPEDRTRLTDRQFKQWLTEFDQAFDEPVLAHDENPSPGEVSSLSVGVQPDRRQPRTVEPARLPAANRRWLVGFAMLVAGLLGGYAAGVAVGLLTFEGRDALSSPSQVADLLDSDLVAKAVLPAVPRISEADRRGSTSPSTNLSPRPVLRRVSAVPAPTSGVLHVESRPRGAQVHLDDRLVATTPFRLYGVSPGSHTVRIDLEGYQPWTTSVNVEGGSGVVRVAASLKTGQ